MKKTNAPAAPSAGNLFSANLAYCQRLGALAQQSQARWLALGQRVMGENAQQFQKTLAPLTQSSNWQDIAPAIGDVARQQWQQRLNAAEALVHTALEEQATLTAGLSDAMNAWMQESASACQGAMPLNKLWTTMAEQMQAATQTLHSLGDKHEH